jgi:hypothetical protein
MFGLNDNNPKPADGASGAPPVSPASAPANPFGDKAAAAPAIPSQPDFNSDAAASAPPAPKPAGPPADNEDLLSLKGQALTSLQPLVGHLDQTPEEKFKTTMMLIQATDNPSLVKQAYEAANQITDEKARAQALLDVVNEINYFTQNHKEDGQKA